MWFFFFLRDPKPNANVQEDQLTPKQNRESIENKKKKMIKKVIGH